MTDKPQKHNEKMEHALATTKTEMTAFIKQILANHQELSIQHVEQAFQEALEQVSQKDSQTPPLPDGATLVQVGNKTSYQPIDPITPKKGSPSISDYVVNNRKQS